MQIKIKKILFTILLLSLSNFIIGSDKEKLSILEELEAKRTIFIEKNDSKSYLMNEQKINSLKILDLDTYRELNNKYHLAIAYYYNNNINESLKILDKFEKDYRKSNKELLIKYLVYGSSVYYNTQPQKAISMLLEAINIIDYNEISLLKYLVSADWALVNINYNKDKNVSQRHIERILEYIDKIPEDNNVFDNIYYYENIINFYYSSGDNEKINSIANSYITTYGDIDDKNPYTIIMYLHLNNYWKSIDLNKSFNFLKKAESLVIKTKFYGSETPGVVYYSIAQNYEEKGNYELALEYYIKAYNMYEKAYNDLYPKGLLKDNRKILRIAGYKDDSARKINELSK